jgi:hypothetical protein
VKALAIAIVAVATSGCSALFGLEEPERRARSVDPIDAFAEVADVDGAAPRDAGAIHDATTDDGTTADSRSDAHAPPPPEPCRDVGAIEERACGDPGGCAREFRECLDDGYGAWSACACDGFRPIAALPLEARFRHAQVWTGERFLVWGGRTKTGLAADGAQYDPRADRWIPMAPAPLSPRSDVAAVWTGRELFVWGGLTGLGSAFDSAKDGALYDPRTDTWRTLPPSSMLGGVETTAFWSSVGQSVVLFGGQYDVDVWLADGATWSPDRGFTRMVRGPLPARSGALGFANAGQAWFFFGDGCDAPFLRCGDAALYDLQSQKWRGVPIPPAVAKASHLGGVSLGDRFAFWDLRPVDGQPVGWLFEPNAGSFEPLPVPAISRAEERTSFAFGHRFGIFGGVIVVRGRAPVVVGDGALFDPAKGTWEDLPAGGPSPRVRAGITAGGNDLLIFGGRRVDPAHYEPQLADGAILRKNR